MNNTTITTSTPGARLIAADVAAIAHRMLNDVGLLLREAEGFTGSVDRLDAQASRVEDDPRGLTDWARGTRARLSAVGDRVARVESLLARIAAAVHELDDIGDQVARAEIDEERRIADGIRSFWSE